MYNINRRKFLGYFGCSCCPNITMYNGSNYERKQLSIISEARINRQAASAYEKFRRKSKLITKGTQLNEIRKIGKRMENAVSSFFENQGKKIQLKILDGIIFL